MTRARALWTPLAVYGVSRLLVLLSTHVAASAGRSRQSLLRLSAQWDGVHYLTLVKDWYPEDLVRVDDHLGTSVHVFFPLYPMVVRVAEWVTPFGEIGAAVLVSLVGGAFAAVLLWRIAERLAGPEVADGAVVLFCLFPGALFLSWVYAEGLTLALVAASLLFLLRDRVWVAALFGALATAARPNSVALVAAFAVLAAARVWGRQRDWPGAVRYAAAGAVASVGFVAFQVYLWILTDERLVWFRVQREGFGEGSRPGKRLFEVVFDEFPEDERIASAMLTVAFLVLAVLLVVVVVRSRVLPLWMRAYALVAMGFAVTANIAPASPRLQLAALPAFIAVAELIRGQARTLLVATTAMLLVVAAIAYANPTVEPFFMWAP